MIGRRHNARHDVVVVPASKVLVLQAGAVVHLGVELCSERSVKHPVGAFEDETRSNIS